MRIDKTELEFEEMYKGKVKPLATGGYIPFLKKFIGRIIYIIVPKEETVFWLLNDEDKQLLKTEARRFRYPEPYSKERKEVLDDALRNISRKEFLIENLINIVDIFEEQNKRKKLSRKAKAIIQKIKNKYSI